MPLVGNISTIVFLNRILEKLCKGPKLCVIKKKIMQNKNKCLINEENNYNLSFF